MVGIYYPIESSLYPNGLIQLGVIVAIIVLIMYFFLWLRHINKKAFPLNIENHLSLGTLIVTVLVVFIPFFIQAPLIDYSVSGPLDTNNTNTKAFGIVIHNYGIVAANDVVISMNSDSEGVRFLNFISNPFLPNSTQFENTGDAAFKIEVLPPRAENTITSEVNLNNNNINLTTYVRSNEAVGYHDTALTLAIYTAVLSIVVPVAIGKLTPWKP